MKQICRYSLHAFRIATIAFLLSCLPAATQAQVVSTGPELGHSDSRSQFFKGLATDSATLVSRIKIVGFDRQPDGSLEARVVALDSDGNFIPLSNAGVQVSADVSCRGQSPIGFQINVADSADKARSGSSAFYVAIDHSMLSKTLTRDVFLSLKRALAEVPSNDSLGIGLINQSLKTMQRVGPLKRTLENTIVDELEESSGISALFASSNNLIREMENCRGNKCVIIVTTTGDNASGHVNVRDVVRSFQDSEIKVFVIRVGLDLASHPLRHFASATGGAIYTLEPDDIAMVGDVIREIILSQHWNSAITIPAGIDVIEECTTPWMRIRLAADSTHNALIDSIALTPRELSLEPEPSIVALFDDTTDVGLQQYYPLLLSIAERMTEDINLKIELIGHVGKGEQENADQRALERAQNVQNFLIVNGVLDKQIIVRSEGNRKPRYYFETDGTRRLMNNRVEAVFIKSEQRPYTVIVDQVNTEDEAMIQRSLWTKRNQKVYHEVINDKGQIVYRIVLWGYASKGIADAAATMLKKQYKPRYTIVE